MLHQTTDVRGPREDVLQLPTAAGQSDVQIRFHHYNASYDWWWEVDDVFVGNRTCDADRRWPRGRQRDVDQAPGTASTAPTVTSVDKPEEKATTAPTPDDAGLDDGFYWLFSAVDGYPQVRRATANQYEASTKTVNVGADDATNGRLRARRPDT